MHLLLSRIFFSLTTAVCGRLHNTWKENSKWFLINVKGKFHWEILSDQGRLFSRLLQKGRRPEINLNSTPPKQKQRARKRFLKLSEREIMDNLFVNWVYQKENPISFYSYNPWATQIGFTYKMIVTSQKKNSILWHVKLYETQF